MSKTAKSTQITASLGKPYLKVIAELYIGQHMAATEISQWIFDRSRIFLTARSIQRNLKKLNLIRTYSEAFNLAIKSGRKKYDKLRKPIKSNDLRKGISTAVRYRILLRDSFKCVLCGKTANDDLLVIDHITPVVAGGDNDPSNLRVLCRECNHGKMLVEERFL